MLLDFGVADYGVRGTSDWTTDSVRKGVAGGQRLEESRDRLKKLEWSFFSTRLSGLSQIDQPLEPTAWQGGTDSIKLLSLLCWSRVGLAHKTARRHWTMLLELFYMLEVCCGSGASSRAMITYMRRIGREGKSIDIMTLEVLLSTYPE